MPSTQAEMKELARAQARTMLAQCAPFHGLDRDAQMEIYRGEVAARYKALAEQAGLISNGRGAGRAPASGATSTALAAGQASDLIDDSRHKNERIDQAGELAGEFMQEIDFPKFVRDLLKGVFDANLNVTLSQMEAYGKLLKTASESITKFVNAIDDTAAFGYLAENQGDNFGIDMSDEKDDAGTPKAVLTDKDGNKLDIGANEVKAKIMEAKIAMAKEQRALLRETILMGITRLVVEKGVVKASVLFDIKASEKIDKADKAAIKDVASTGASISAGGGLVGKLIGGPFGGGSHSRQKTKISVSSAKSAASTDLAATVAGSVEIQFKSDYFKLDNFATMYGPVTAADKNAVAPAASPK